MAYPRNTATRIDTGQDVALSSQSGYRPISTPRISAANSTVADSLSATNSNAAIINLSDGSQFIQLTNRSLAEIINQGNQVQVYQSKDNVYVEAISVSPTQQYITNDVDSPGGANLSVQFNLAGNLQGSDSLQFNPATNTLAATAVAANLVTLLSTANLRIGGGTSGWYLQTDGNGGLAWAAAGNGTVPGGINGQFQYNNNGSLGGSTLLTQGSNTVNVAANLNVAVNLNVAGNLNVTGNGTTTTNTQRANTLIIGNDAVNARSITTYYQAMTNDGAPGQVLLSIPAANVSSIDFNVTAEDYSGTSKQISKLIALSLNGVTNYSEYGSLALGSQLGDFSADQSSGNIRLLVTPTSSTMTRYNVVYTIFNNY